MTYTPAVPAPRYCPDCHALQPETAVPAPASRRGNQPKCPVCGSTWRAECMMSKPDHLPPRLDDAASRSGEDHAALWISDYQAWSQGSPTSDGARLLVNRAYHLLAILSRDSGEAVKLAARLRLLAENEDLSDLDDCDKAADLIESLSANAARLTGERDEYWELYQTARKLFLGADKRAQDTTEDNKRLREDGQAFLTATEALLDWINGNDLSADHEDQGPPEDYQRLCDALERFCDALERFQAALSPTAGPAEGQECDHDFEQLAEHKFRCMKCGEDFNRIWTAKDDYVGKAPADGTEEK